MKLLRQSDKSFAGDSDEQLIAAMREGNHDGFSALFDRHWDNVFRMIYARTGDKEAAEEMAQDIFVKLWDKREELQIENFSAYLYACIKHRCLNYIESRITRKKHWEFYKQFLPAHDDATYKVVALNDLKEALEKGLTSIPEKSRKVFTLNRLEGQTVKEIAGQMNLSEKAIQYHLTRSVRELRLYLKEFLALLLLMYCG
jgi:RNA polymerase sigma-70 factor (ECF subfamily)